jgi:hypothetical protein
MLTLHYTTLHCTVVHIIYSVCFCFITRIQLKTCLSTALLPSLLPAHPFSPKSSTRRSIFLVSTEYHYLHLLDILHWNDENVIHYLYCGLWHQVALHVASSVSEECIASTFWVNPIQWHNPDNNSYLHCCENHKSQTVFILLKNNTSFLIPKTPTLFPANVLLQFLD